MKKQIRKQVKRKIKSETGASILIALLVFLIAAMTGSVILTSATVSSGAVNRCLQEYQDMASLKSAASLISDELKEPVDVSTDDSQSPSPVSNDTLNKEGFHALQQYMADYVNANGEACDYRITSVKLNDNADKNTVAGTITMDTDYTVSVDLWVVDPKDSNEKRSQLFIRFDDDPVVDDNPDDNVFQVRQSGAVITTENTEGADSQ